MAIRQRPKQVQTPNVRQNASAQAKPTAPKGQKSVQTTKQAGASSRQTAVSDKFVEGEETPDLDQSNNQDDADLLYSSRRATNSEGNLRRAQQLAAQHTGQPEGKQEQEKRQSDSDDQSNQKKHETEETDGIGAADTKTAAASGAVTGNVAERAETSAHQPTGTETSPKAEQMPSSAQLQKGEKGSAARVEQPQGEQPKADGAHKGVSTTAPVDGAASREQGRSGNVKANAPADAAKSGDGKQPSGAADTTTEKRAPNEARAVSESSDSTAAPGSRSPKHASEAVAAAEPKSVSAEQGGKGQPAERGDTSTPKPAQPQAPDEMKGAVARGTGSSLAAQKETNQQAASSKAPDAPFADSQKSPSRAAASEHLSPKASKSEGAAPSSKGSSRSQKGVRDEPSGTESGAAIEGRTAAPRSNDSKPAGAKGGVGNAKRADGAHQATARAPKDAEVQSTSRAEGKAPEAKPSAAQIPGGGSSQKEASGGKAGQAGNSKAAAFEKGGSRASSPEKVAKQPSGDGRTQAGPETAGVSSARAGTSTSAARGASQTKAAASGSAASAKKAEAGAKGVGAQDKKAASKNTDGSGKTTSKGVSVEEDVRKSASKGRGVKAQAIKSEAKTLENKTRLTQETFQAQRTRARKTERKERESKQLQNTERRKFDRMRESTDVALQQVATDVFHVNSMLRSVQVDPSQVEDDALQPKESQTFRISNTAVLPPHAAMSRRSRIQEQRNESNSDEGLDGNSPQAGSVEQSTGTRVQSPAASGTGDRTGALRSAHAERGQENPQSVPLSGGAALSQMKPTDIGVSALSIAPDDLIPSLNNVVVGLQESDIQDAMLAETQAAAVGRSGQAALPFSEIMQSSMGDPMDAIELDAQERAVAAQAQPISVPFVRSDASRVIDLNAVKIVNEMAVVLNGQGMNIADVQDTMQAAFGDDDAEGEEEGFEEEEDDFE